MGYAERRKELVDRIQHCIKVALIADGQGAPAYDQAIAEMQGNIGLLNDLGNQEIAEAHSELTRKTEELTRITSRLKVATWILFFATLVLSFATIALFLMKVYEIVRSS